jgi:hypothetical protein
MVRKPSGKFDKSGTGKSIFKPVKGAYDQGSFSGLDLAQAGLRVQNFKVKIKIKYGPAIFSQYFLAISQEGLE